MRIIDADELSKTIKETCLLAKPWDYVLIEQTIADAPTIEPERKKGRWIEDHKLFGKGPTAFKCSVCGTIGIDCDDYKFCHMCGADMRGDT